MRKRVHVKTAAATKRPAFASNFHRIPAAFDHAMRARARSELLWRAGQAASKIFLTILSLVPAHLSAIIDAMMCMQ
jgi:hypothetical protein